MVIQLCFEWLKGLRSIKQFFQMLYLVLNEEEVVASVVVLVASVVVLEASVVVLVASVVVLKASVVVLGLKKN